MIYPHSIGPNEPHPFLSEFKSLFELVFNSVGKNYFKHDHLPVHTFARHNRLRSFVTILIRRMTTDEQIRNAQQLLEMPNNGEQC